MRLILSQILHEEAACTISESSYTEQSHTIYKSPRCVQQPPRIEASNRFLAVRQLRGPTLSRARFHDLLLVFSVNNSQLVPKECLHDTVDFYDVDCFDICRLSYLSVNDSEPRNLHFRGFPLYGVLPDVVMICLDKDRRFSQ